MTDIQRILITGDRGYFGSRFHAIYDDQFIVLGIDKDDVDIIDAPAVSATIREFAPDLVIHAAAVTSTDFSNAHPELTRRINVEGAVNVGRAAAAVGSKVIFISTEQVFNGNPEPGPYSEDDVPIPDTMYGETKLEAEQRLRDVVEELWVLRFTWLFGIAERFMPVNPNILWNTLQLAVRGETVAIPTEEYRGHTWGYDMLEALMRVPEIPYGTYHIGSRNDLGRYDLTCHILRLLGLPETRIADLVIPDRDKYRDHPRDIRLSADRIAGEGIVFETTSNALERVLSEFSLNGMAAR